MKNNFTFAEMNSWEPFHNFFSSFQKALPLQRLASFKVTCSWCHFGAKIFEVSNMVDGGHRLEVKAGGYNLQSCTLSLRHLLQGEDLLLLMPFWSVGHVPKRVLEPNTYECPIRTIRTYWAEILIFDQKMSCSAQYVRMAMTLKILQVLVILPRKIYNFTKDNSTHGNFVQGQLDQRQFRPNSIVSVSTRISWSPPVGVTWDNSTKSNFAQIQLCPFPLYIYLNLFKVISHLIRVYYLYLRKLDPR